jgi:uncharacterized membrane protein YbhN (UPF0104 family)
MNQDGAPSALMGELELPEELSSRKLRTQLLLLAAILLTGVAIVTLLPGLAALRTRLSHAQPGWIVVGAALKVLSSLGYVVVFRVVFGRRMSRRVSYQIGMSEVGANAVVPTGGAGGLALGAWALKRGGMPTPEIARRELGGLIPVPGGIGGVDAGLVGTLVIYNVPITAATSAVLAYRAITLWVPAILGSAAFLSLRRTVRHTAHEILGDPETTREHPRASTRALHGRDRHAQARS